MKRITKEPILIIISVIALLFLITVYFIGFEGEGLLFSTIGGTFGTVQSEAAISEVHRNLESVTVEVPQIRYVGGARAVGDVVTIEEMFEIEYEDGTTLFAAEDESITVSLMDIRDSSDNVVITKLNTEDIESLEEIPTAFIYDQEQNVLHFHRSGVYKVYIKLYSGSMDGITYEFSLPVEVGDL